MKKYLILSTILASLVTSPSFAEEVEDETTIKPIPTEIELNLDKVDLGKKLYFDTQLSKDGTISCASCHALEKGGTDQTPTSTGIGGQVGPINSPTVYNSGANFVQFWDGRAATLEEQALGPVENPAEMGEKWADVIIKLKADASYKAGFDKIYQGSITKEHAADAIAEFERSLITPDSRFDKYLKGDETALTKQEILGYNLFLDKGCNSCHSGTYLGGNSYQAMSEDYFTDRGNITEADYGRFNVTKDEDDKYIFKVPTLRNVEVTAPYFHDGQVKTLEEAVTLMAKYQLGDEITQDDAKAISAFLRSTTGKYQGKYLDEMQ